jgi:hypothetical protein
MSDTHDEFTIQWRDGKYYVSTPDLRDIRVVPLLRYNAVVAERDKAVNLLNRVVTVCRDCRDELPWLCEDVPLADFIFWGKLLPPEALGPKCYEHAAKHVGHAMLAGHGDRFNVAAVDLRPIKQRLGL